MRVVWVVFIAFSLLLGASVDQKIKRAKRELVQTKKQMRGVHIKLSKLARQIKTLQKELVKIDKRLENLDEELKRAKELYKTKQEEYEKTKKAIQSLTQKESKLKQKLLLLISKEFSKSLLLTSMQNPTQEDILKEEILKAIQAKESTHIKKVGKEYSQTLLSLKKSRKRLAQLEEQIASLLQKQKELKSLKQIKAKKVKSLVAKKRNYDKILQELKQQRKSLIATLQKLNLIKKERTQQSASSKLKVKNYGQKSYKRIRTVRYKGPKTIAPLDQFIILKRYGVYKDPIYNIEIPNENIELKPLVPDAKVRNVLNGRVVLAKWTPHLKNVVIVQHNGGLYTIYAYLDKLAPYIKKGRKLKKGYTIGRVSNKLIFEVTKNNYHINPLDLIKVK